MQYEDINQIVSTTHHTVNKLLQYQNWPNALALYFRYIQQRKMQENSTTYSTDKFMMKAMWWGKERFTSAKKVLIKENLIEAVKRRDKQGKIISHYVKVNFITSITPETQTVGDPDGGKQETNTLVVKPNTLPVKPKPPKKKKWVVVVTEEEAIKRMKENHQWSFKCDCKEHWQSLIYFFRCWYKYKKNETLTDINDRLKELAKEAIWFWQDQSIPRSTFLSWLKTYHQRMSDNPGKVKHVKTSLRNAFITKWWALWR